MTLRSNVRAVRSGAYRTARVLGWVEALMSPRPGQALMRRAGRVALGRGSGRAINKIFPPRRY